jgi:acyl-coenzyme A thioesterase PaaI-like protein
LTCEQREIAETANGKPNIDIVKHEERGAYYKENLKRLRNMHHSLCLFSRQPSIVPGLRFLFDDSGALHGVFACNKFHQGYDGMAHGGVIAAIVDASMTQCLMGHGIVGYTTDLSIQYRKPVLIGRKATLETSVKEVKMSVLYSMRCEIVQDRNLVVQATGRFFKVE